MQGIDSDLIRGHIDTIILKVLFEGDKYGYEICKEVEEKSNGTYELKQPTLYSCLKRLEDKGLISSYWEESDIGGKRHYYKLTEEGRQTFQENYDEWTRSRAIIDNLISNPYVREFSAARREAEESEKKEALAPTIDDETLKKAVQEAYEKGLSEGKKEADLNKASEEKDEKDKEQERVVESLLSSSYSDEGDIIPWGTAQETAADDDAETYTWHDEDDAFVATTANGEAVEATPSPIQPGEFEPDEELPFEEEVSKAQASFFESQDEEEKEPPILIEHNEETAISYEEKPLLDAPEEKPEENNQFVFDLDGFRLKSNESYFESEEIANPKPDYVAEMKIDGLKEEPKEEKEEEKEEPNIASPIYHDFGADSLIKKHEDEIYVDDSNLDADSIYLNPDAVKDDDEEESEQLTLFTDEVKKEEETPFEEDYSAAKSDENSEDIFAVEDNSAGNSTFMDFYKTTDGYENLDPSYTDEDSKEKLSSLMDYGTNEEPKKEEHAPRVMTYSELRADFEKEGLVVREHKKHLKEAKATRSYIESNKINLVTSWTTFGIVTFLLTLAYFISTNYRNAYNTAIGAASDSTFKYFLIGMAILAIVPIIYTILFFINPYKKKPARYAFRIYMLFAVLLTVQLMIITYCVNLQLGFYSFSQPTYNHLLWVVPCIMSLYPILDAILHNIYFKSKNFHV